MFKSWMPACAGMTIALLSFIPTSGCATSWPTFTPPSLAFLAANNMVTQANCPAGQGKITPNLKLNIQQHFCRRYCPSEWEWILADNHTCHPLADFEFQRYGFKYVRNGSGETETLYTKVTAYYGKVTNREPAFKFTFTSEKDNHWQCAEMNPEIHNVICANDM